VIEAEQSDLRDLNVMDTLMTSYWKDASNRTHEEDRIAAFLGMQSGDSLFYCPDHRMSMKLAEMKVFWNGCLKPLANCEDDKWLHRNSRIYSPHMKTSGVLKPS
jgi:hypothetical protein